MQGKGIIKFFIVVVALACLYSISFTFVTRSVEKDAAAYAQGDLEKERAYLDSMANEPVYNLGFAQYTYQDAKERELSLGLRSEGHTSELQSRENLVCRLLLEKINIGIL